MYYVCKLGKKKLNFILCLRSVFFFCKKKKNQYNGLYRLSTKLKFRIESNEDDITITKAIYICHMCAWDNHKNRLVVPFFLLKKKIGKSQLFVKNCLPPPYVICFKSRNCQKQNEMKNKKIEKGGQKFWIE